MYDDSELTVLINSGHRTARIAHKCSECRRAINPGERYHFDALKFDGAIQMVKTCVHCEVVREWLSNECGGWVYTELEEDIRGHCHRGGYPYGVYRLAAGMHRYWTRRDGSLMPLPKLPATTHERMAV